MLSCSRFGLMKFVVSESANTPTKNVRILKTMIQNRINRPGFCTPSVSIGLEKCSLASLVKKIKTKTTSWIRKRFKKLLFIGNGPFQNKEKVRIFVPSTLIYSTFTSSISLDSINFLLKTDVIFSFSSSEMS